MKKLAIPFLLLFAIFLSWCTTSTQIELLEQQNQILQQQIEQQQKQLEQKQTTENSYDTNTYQAPTTTKTYTPPKEIKNSNCTIKWNISYNWWEKIYHVPWCTSYNATIIDTSKWEKRFCTEAEARAAWWRKAYNCP